MNQERQIIKDGAIAVAGSDIIAVGEEKELLNDYDVEWVLDAEGMAVLPGFVNVHTHLPSIFVRGVYGVVREGLYQVLFPVKKFLEPEHCYTLGLASCLEALTSGCTTIQETYNYMDEFAKAAEVTGIRADLGEQVAEADYQSIKDGTYRYIPKQAEEMLKRAMELKQNWHGRGEGRITVSWAPLAPDMCTPWVYEEIQRYQEAGEKISTHIAQSKREVEQVKTMYNKTSVEHLDHLGTMGPDVIGAHCILNTDNDLEIMRKANAGILHCPRPYLLGGTTAPLARWLNLGIKVGLGTDNVYHTMWETMRAALYGARIKEAEGEPASPSYYKILELATIDGAKVLGMENMIGSLESGKKADIQLINLRHPHLLPTVDFTSSLVLYGGTTNVDTVIVDGKIVKQNGAITMEGEEKILEDAQNTTTEIWEKLFSESPELREIVKTK